jgi:nitrous oxidase accessory protein NosD
MRLRSVAMGVAATGGLLASGLIGSGMAGASTPHHSQMIFVSPNAHGNGHSHHGGGDSPEYRSIGAAIAAARAGDTVVIARGTYHEGLSISKPLTLRGEPGAVIDANKHNNGIAIHAANVTIKGLTIEHAIGEGLLVDGANNATITNNVVKDNDLGGLPKNAVPNHYMECAATGAVPGDCGEGIHLMGSSHSIVAHNMSENNSGGILLSDEGAPTSHNLVLDNIVRNNLFDCGITVVGHNPAAAPNGKPAASVAGVYDNTVRGNDITGNGVQGAGAGVVMATGLAGGAVYNNLIEDNHMAGNGQSAVTVHSHLAGQFLNGNVVTHNQIGINNIRGDSDSGAKADTQTTGVLVGTVDPLSITVTKNVISGDHFGLWTQGPAHVAGAGDNTFRHVSDPISNN